MAAKNEIIAIAENKSIRETGIYCDWMNKAAGKAMVNSLSSSDDADN